MTRSTRDRWVMEAPLYARAGSLDSPRTLHLGLRSQLFAARGGEMGRVRVQAPQDLVAGASLLAVSLFALWAAPLDAGRMSAPGPGLLPRVLAVLLGGVGVWLVVVSLVRPGESLGHWSLRGPVLIALSVVAFAVTIRTPGLAVAGAGNLLGRGDGGVRRAVPLAPAPAHPHPGDSRLGGPVRGRR